VNGSKIFTTHSTHAEVMLAYVRFAPGVGGIGSVLIDLKAPGVRSGRPSKFMSDEEWAQIYFENVFVSADSVVLKEGGSRSRSRGSTSSGSATRRARSRSAVTPTNARGSGRWQRKQFGRLLCEFQGLQWKFADMKMKLDAGQLLLYRAAAERPTRIPVGGGDPIAKAFCNQAGYEIANEAAAGDGRARLHAGGTGRVLRAPLPWLDDRRRLDRDPQEPDRRKRVRAELPAAPGSSSLAGTGRADRITGCAGN